MSSEDRYDSRGRLLDGPDDPDTVSCDHDNDGDVCRECRADFEREEDEYRSWRQANVTLDVPYPDDLADLPW